MIIIRAVADSLTSVSAMRWACECLSDPMDCAGPVRSKAAPLRQCGPSRSQPSKLRQCGFRPCPVGCHFLFGDLHRHRGEPRLQCFNHLPVWRSLCRCRHLGRCAECTKTHCSRAITSILSMEASRTTRWTSASMTTRCSCGVPSFRQGSARTLGGVAPHPSNVD